MKKCSKCGKTKELSEFSKRTDAGDGLQSRCKVCAKDCKDAIRAKGQCTYGHYRADTYELIYVGSGTELRSKDLSTRNPIHKFIQTQTEIVVAYFDKGLTQSEALKLEVELQEKYEPIAVICKGNSIPPRRVKNCKGQEFDSVNEAARAFGVSQGNISNVCNPKYKRKSAGKYEDRTKVVWEYI